MSTKPGILFFHALSPIHAGMGSSMSHIDLPIQREKTTEFPMIQSGGIKGAMRSWCKEARLSNEASITDCWIQTTFGPEPEHKDLFQGALCVTDARILLFPVASEPGVFTFVTCPMVLEQLQYSLMASGLTSRPPFGSVPVMEDESSVLVTSTYPQRNDLGGYHWLRDLPLSVDRAQRDWMTGLAESLGSTVFGPHGTPPEDHFLKAHLKNYIVLVHNEVFRDLVVEATDVRTRIRIDETGVVQDGALWTEESLPIHSVLYSMLFLGETEQEKALEPESEERCFRVLNKTFSSWVKVTQLGGDKTLGSGWVRAECFDTKAPMLQKSLCALDGKKREE